MCTPAPPVPSVAEAVWEQLAELAELQRCRVAGLARELDLPATQLLALRHLEPGRPRPMGRLADVLECDKGNVTGIVDRLERRGLVERRPVEHDRRIKVLALTAEGERVRGAIDDRLRLPPQALCGAGEDALRRVADALVPVLDELRAARDPDCAG
jgi:DNA-binding MarR family transcriptional regulator